MKNPYQPRLDSLSKYRKQNLAEGDSTLDKLKGNITRLSKSPDSLQTRIANKATVLTDGIHKKTSFTDSLSSSLKENEHINLSNTESGLTNVTSDKSADGILTLPDNINLPKAEAPGELTNIQNDASNLEKASTSKIEELGSNKDLIEVKDGIGKVGSVTGKIEGYNKDLKTISNGNIDKMEALPKDIENMAMQQKPLKELGSEVKAGEASKNVLMQYQDAAKKMNEDGGKSALKNIASKELPDYFAGNEKKLQAGVAKLEKLKRKYGSVPDSRYLPKHVPNAMKDKPFIEHVVPGINFQVFQIGGYSTVDISPFVMYKITTRWRTGIGSTYRMQFDKNINFVHAHDAHGYRIMTNYTLFGGFNFHVEGEWIRMVPYNPTTNTRLNDSEKKQWITSLNVGILKHYKISNHVQGNFQALYNFCYHRNGLYPNKLNIRFGFEFPLKKKVKENDKHQ
ncbi:MAG TPA: hypothetical protein VIM65_19855 [Cyclobacteriaceae bacterium]